MWICLPLSVILHVAIARYWTDASIPQLEVAEAALLRKYGQVRVDSIIDVLSVLNCYSLLP